MEELKGIVCECCKKEFQKDDEVAYCPVCGAPVHLSCWKERGGCPFEEKHAEGFIYQIPAKTESAPVNIKINGDVYSGTQERADAQSYHTDGDGFDSEEETVRRLRQLLDNARENAAKDGYNDEAYKAKKYDGVSEQEIAHFLNIDHPQKIYRFLTIKYMIENKRKVSLNFFAGILNPYNQFYKGMTALGLLLTLFNYIMGLPQLIIYYLAVWKENGAEIAADINQAALFNASTLLGMLQFAVVTLLCVFGDYLYITFMIKKIKAVRSRFTDDQSDEYMAALSNAGRAKPGLVAVGVLLQGLLTLVTFSVLSNWIS